MQQPHLTPGQVLLITAAVWWVVAAAADRTLNVIFRCIDRVKGKAN